MYGNPEKEAYAFLRQTCAEAIATGRLHPEFIDPDELATFAVDPNGGAKSWFTGYSDPKVTALVHRAQHETNPAARCRLYARMQDISAQDAFAGFLYYSPFAYAFSNKVHGFHVSPLGNFHLEEVWLG